MRIRGVTYHASQLEKAIECLAEEHALYVEMCAQVVFQNRPVEYRCILQEAKYRGGIRYVGIGDSLFKALSNAYAGYLGETTT